MYPKEKNVEVTPKIVLPSSFFKITCAPRFKLCLPDLRMLKFCFSYIQTQRVYQRFLIHLLWTHQLPPRTTTSLKLPSDCSYQI